MGRSFDGPIYFGKIVKCHVTTSNIAAKLKFALDAVHAATEKTYDIAEDIKGARRTLESKLKEGLRKMRADEPNRQVLLRAGVSRGDIIVHLKYSDQNLKEEMWFIASRSIRDALKGNSKPGVTDEKQKKASREKVISLQPDDKTVKMDTPVIRNKRSAKVLTEAEWKKNGNDPKKVKIDQPLGLFAHGASRCPDLNKVIGIKLAGKNETELANLIRPLLPVDYKGLVSLYGCFTAAGDPNGADASLAKKVFDLLKPQFPAIRVRGMADSWGVDKNTGELVSRATTVKPMTIKSGIQTLAGAELKGEKDVPGGYVDDAGRFVVGKAPNLPPAPDVQKNAVEEARYFLRKLEISRDALLDKEEEIRDKILGLIGEVDTDVSELTDDQIARAKQNGEANKLLAPLEAVEKQLAKMVKQIEELEEMAKSETRNYTRTFRDKAAKT